MDARRDRGRAGPEAAESFCRVYDVTEAGNFEGRNILHLSRSLEVETKMLGREPAALVAELAAARSKLLLAGPSGSAPAATKKCWSVGTAWPSSAGPCRRRLGEPRTRPRPCAAAHFLLTHLRAGPLLSIVGAAVRPNTRPISTITPR